MHDALVLLGLVVADGLILFVWWFLGSRLVPAAANPQPADVTEHTPRMHKVLTVVAFLLLVGLLIESMAMFPAILMRFGWS